MNAGVLDLRKNISTLNDVLKFYADTIPDKTVYTFLNYLNDDVIEQRLTYSELHGRAQKVAAWFQNRDAQGERALLIFPPGLDYIAAYLGCFYAGVIAVPIYPPMTPKLFGRFESILSDSESKFAVTISPVMDGIKTKVNSLQWLATDTLPHDIGEDYKDTTICKDDIAFLQYTSGSTSVPKGVIVTHNNLLDNLFQIRRFFELSERTRTVYWLPFYHDMGLVGGLLETLYCGGSGVYISPLDFLQKPVRWLQAITGYKATLSGGPNFAYELCARKITREEISALDLSSWELAFSGAEPVRMETVNRFTEIFTPCGFKKEAMYPCYGLAEATLFVSGGKKSAAPIVKHIKTDKLEKNEIVEAQKGDKGVCTFVGCGQASPDWEVIIVNPHSLKKCPSNMVGEIWVSGESVARGYWNRTSEDSDSIFKSYTDSGEGPFLRTGDLGFINNNELYISGRRKDLIIIRGRNHYPQDIERTIEESHSVFRKGCSAAFSIDVNDAEQLVVVQEVKKDHINTICIKELAQQAGQAILEQHEIHSYAVLFLKPGSISKTSSGKIQRHACKQKFMNKTLDIIGNWDQYLPVDTAQKQKADFQSWIVNTIANKLKVPCGEIDVKASFSSFGFGSLESVEFSGQLEEWLGQRISPAILYDYSNIKDLTEYLVSEAGNSKPDRHHKQNEEQNTENEAVAIIGMYGIMPQSEDPDHFWEHLEEGRNLVTEVPEERWDWKSLSQERSGARWGAFIRDIDKFDNTFFDISQDEADVMDPQQRIFLETVWKTIENAGYRPSELSGTKTGVFAGVANTDYTEIIKTSASGLNPAALTGNSYSIIANRVSYHLNLRGPSESINTACSSALVAIQRGVESIQSGICSMAIAGGVNAILTPSISVAFDLSRSLAKDGRCKTFDKRADGYVRGEGVGALLLKPLKSAIAEGDHVYAVIRGAGSNHGGRSHSLSAPNAQSQKELLVDVYEQAKIDPGTIGYIETHGTGSLLGDVIEIEGLKSAFDELRKKKNITARVEKQCGIGSVKTNIGHLESAAGIAGIFKVLLAMKHKKLPPTINLDTVNPFIDLHETPFYIVNTVVPWERLIGEKNNPLPRRAGVSSFGFGGVNAHVILEEYERKAGEDSLPKTAAQHWELVVFSAGNEERLREYAGKTAEYLDARPEMSLANIAFTLGTGREPMKERLALVVSNKQELCEKLVQYAKTGNKGSNENRSEQNDAAGDLEEQAERWVAGIQIDWELFYRDKTLRRIPLPGSPLEKKRCWVK